MAVYLIYKPELGMICVNGIVQADGRDSPL